MNANTNADNFREQMIEIMAEHGLALTNDSDLSNMEGQELDDAKDNNRGMIQMYEELTQLHERLMTAAVKRAAAANNASTSAECAVVPAAAATKPKRTRAPKKTETTEPAVTDDSDVEPPKTTKKRASKKAAAVAAATDDQQQSADEEAPKVPKKRSSKKSEKVAGSDEENAEQQDQPQTKPKKRAAKKADSTEGPAVKSAYQLFGEHVNTNNSDGWEDISVDITCAKKSKVVTDIEETNIDVFNKFMAMKGSKTTMKDLLENSQKLLQEAFARVDNFKLAGLMWAALGGVLPKQWAPASN